VAAKNGDAAAKAKVKAMADVEGST
jgi:hypothetical protein